MDVSVCAILVIIMLRWSEHTLFCLSLMRPINYNRGNNNTFNKEMQHSRYSGTWSMFVQKNKGPDRVCSNTFFLETRLSASRHQPQQRRETHLFAFPAEIQCGIFSFQGGALWLFSRDYEVTATDRRWRTIKLNSSVNVHEKAKVRGCAAGRRNKHTEGSIFTSGKNVYMY